MNRQQRSISQRGLPHSGPELIVPTGQRQRVAPSQPHQRSWKSRAEVQIREKTSIGTGWAGFLPFGRS